MTAGIITVRTTPRFEKHFRRLPTSIQKRAIEKDQLFRKDPRHVALKTHQLQGVLHGFWSYSVTYHYRVLFRFISSSEVLYYDIGTHRIY